MPRVELSKKRYKVQDLAKYIVGEMYGQCITQEEMAAELGISQPAFSKKLKTCSFDYGDLLTVFNKLNTEESTIIKLMRM